MSKLQNLVFSNIKNIPGKKSSRKIVVFSVDDYGSVRVKDSGAYKTLKTAGIPMDKGRFSRYDTMADKNDLRLLFDIFKGIIPELCGLIISERHHLLFGISARKYYSY